MSEVCDYCGKWIDHGQVRELPIGLHYHKAKGTAAWRDGTVHLASEEIDSKSCWDVIVHKLTWFRDTSFPKDGYPPSTRRAHTDTDELANRRAAKADTDEDRLTPDEHVVLQLALAGAGVNRGQPAIHAFGRTVDGRRVRTAEDLAALDYERLSRVKGVGPKTIEDLREKLNAPFIAEAEAEIRRMTGEEA